MKLHLTIFLSFILAQSPTTAFAQETTEEKQRPIGQIRGQLNDRASGAILEGASVELLNSTPRRVAFSDARGQFRFEEVPVGRHRLRVELKSYESMIVNEVLVSSGKEFYLALRLEELVQEQEEQDNSVLNKALRKKQLEGLREEGLSMREFRPEEISRYAGGLNDPARLATTVAGVYNTDDSQNYIINRGNSPLGVLWQVEGVPIQNPNHFATLGNSGASFPLLNTNALDNSTLHFGALGAEYGNSFSAVLDMKLRKGNDSKHEFSGQLSLLGAEFLAEGPLRKGQSSYLISYRYSLLSIITALGLPIGTSAAPNYQDLNFTMHIEQPRGYLKVFGLGGYSRVALLDANIDPNDLFSERGRNLYIDNWQALVGISQRYFINPKTYLHTTLSYQHADYRSLRDSLVRGTGEELPLYRVEEIQAMPGISTVLNSKLKPQLQMRQGLRVYTPRADIYDRFVYPRDSANYRAADWFLHVEAFSDWNWRPFPRLQVSGGVHGQYYSLNAKTWAIEPRLQLEYQLGKSQSLGFAAGMHSKLPPYSMLFYTGSDNEVLDNRSLDLLRSVQAVLSHVWQFAPHWRLRSEAYGYYHYNIPVAPDWGIFSLINYGDFALFPQVLGLESSGQAGNYGTELVLERQWFKGIYSSLSASYFESYYQGSDAQWRETAFNSRYMFQAIAGRETRFGKQKRHLFTMDIRLNYRGPRPYQAIDLEASRAAGREIIDRDAGFSDRLSAYKRVDFKIGARFNSKKVSQYLYLDIINVLGFRNELQKRYIPEQGDILSTYQFGILPNIFYQVQF